MTIKFEKIKPGMNLFDARKNTNAFSSHKWSIWPVYVKEVDEDKRRVFASWNNNPPRWISEREVTKYRAKRPKP